MYIGFIVFKASGSLGLRCEVQGVRRSKVMDRDT